MLNSADRLRRNIRLLYVNSFLEYSYYIDAIYVLFGTHYLHLSYFRAGSLFFIGWFTSIAFDFLGGVLADTVGRKRTQLYGLVLQFAGFVPYLFVKSYAALAVGSFVWGIGMAFTSNTLQALVYEQAVELGRKKTYQNLSANSQVWIFAGIASAGLIGGVTYHLSPLFPYGLMLIALAAAFVVCLQMDVPKRVEAALGAKSKGTAVAATALRTFQRHPNLLLFVVVSFFAGICSDLLFSYYQPYFINLHVTAITLGVVYAGIRVVSGYGSYLMRKAPDVISLPAIQALGIVFTGVAAALLLLLKLPIVVAVPVVTAIGFGFTEPAMRLFVNRHAENSARAATLSFGSAVMNLGVGIGFTVSFWMADRFTSTTILKVILLATTGTLLLSIFTLRIKQQPGTVS